MARRMPSVAASFLFTGLLLLLAGLGGTSRAGAQGGNWCGNPIPPCDPDNPASRCFKPPPPDPRCEPRECKKCTKSPCYVGSGVYVRQAVDLRLPSAAGFPLEVSRSYDSSQVIDGPMGYGWTSGLTARLYHNVYLLEAPDVVVERAQVTMPDGARYLFSGGSTNAFTPPAGRHDKLVENADGSFDLTLQHTRSVYHFDAGGALAWMADDFGNRLEYSYDLNGRLQHVADGAGSGRFVDVYWGADGRISSIADSAGRTVTYQYDPSGHLTSEADPIGRTTTYFYAPGKYVPLLSEVHDNWDRIITKITYDPQDRVASYTDKGETWSYLFNYLNDPSKTAKKSSAGDTWVFTHGPAGLVTQEQWPGIATARSTSYLPDGSIQLETDEVGVKTLHAYDADGRLLSETKDYGGPSAVRFDYEYDTAFPTKVAAVTAHDPVDGQLDPNWQSFRYEYYPAGSPSPGALHRVLRIEADGVTLDLVATYEYDTHGRLTARTDGAGGRIDLIYDAQGNVVEVEAPSNNDQGVRPSTLYSYDSLGRVVARTTPLGSTTTYTYDAVDRVTAITLPAPAPASGLDYTTRFQFDDFDPLSGLVTTSRVDPNGNVSKRSFDEFGQLRRTEDGGGAVTTYTYDRGRLTAVQDADGYQTSYSYDALGRKVGKLFPDGTSESYTYWADGQLKSRQDRRGSITSFAYDHLKRPQSRTRPDGTTVTFTYLGQMATSVQDTRVIPAETIDFSYDSSYRRIAESQASRGALDYAYDAADRLVKYHIQNGPTVLYGYYPDGSIDTIDWSVVVGSFKHTYDRDGQLESVTFPNGQSRLYSYDAQGRLTQLRNLDPVGGDLATFSYGYDWNYETNVPGQLGQRTSQTVSIPALSLTNFVTQYSYDARYQLIRASHLGGPASLGTTVQWDYDRLGNRVKETRDGIVRAYSYSTINPNVENWRRLTSDGSNSYSYDTAGNLSSKTGPDGTWTYLWNGEGELAEVDGSTTETLDYDFALRWVGVDDGLAARSFLYSGFELVESKGPEDVFFLHGGGVDNLLAMYRNGQISYVSVDGLGSVVGVDDEAGVITQAQVYDAWGNVAMSSGGQSPPVGYTGREAGVGGLWYYRTRWYDSGLGRFNQEDKLGDAMALSGRELYPYVENDPVSLVDPFGLIQCKSRLYFGPFSYGRKQVEATAFKKTKVTTCWAGAGDPACGDDPGALAAEGAHLIPGSGWQSCWWERWVTEFRKYRVQACVEVTCVCPKSESTSCEWWSGVERSEPRKDTTVTTSTWMTVFTFKECRDPNGAN